jgi:hypothetical protein
MLYVIHCGCDVLSSRGEPFYIDGEGEWMEQRTDEQGPRHDK